MRPESRISPANLKLFGSMLVVALTGFAVVTTQGQVFQPSIVVAPGVTFSTLSGANGAPYAGHTEGDFTVTVTGGVWQEAWAYGNPVPSILDGPIGLPGSGSLLITDNVDLFTFGSLSFSSNNGDSSYDIQGFLGASVIYHQTGTLAGSFTPFSFKTLGSDSPALEFDSLLIQFIPGPEVTSINLDNISVATIPEPGTVVFMLLAVVAVMPRASTRS